MTDYQIDGLKAEADLYHRAYQLTGAGDISEFLALCQSVRSLEIEVEALRQNNKRLQQTLVLHQKPDTVTLDSDYYNDQVIGIERMQRFLLSLEKRLLKDGNPFDGDDWELMQEVRVALGTQKEMPK